MTLRGRLTVLVTLLLGAVLLVAGVALASLDADATATGLEQRARRRARTSLANPFDPPPPPAAPPPAPAMGDPSRDGDPSRSAAPPTAGDAGMGRDPAMAGRPPPPDPLRDGEPPPDDAPPPPPPPPRDGDGDPAMDAPPPPPAPVAGGESTGVRTLAAEADAAHVEVLHVDADPSGGGPLRIRVRGSTGPALVEERHLEAALRGAVGGGTATVEIAGRAYTAVVELLGMPRGPRGRGPGGVRPGVGPGAARAVFAVAFVQNGPAMAALRARRGRTALIGAGALVLGGLLAFATTGRMLRPLRNAATAAERIATPSERLPAPASHDELGRLVTVVNAMLGRLEDASTRERQFLATASHELRRPLTSLLGELELASEPTRTVEALRASLALAASDAHAMHRLVEDLLAHARARAGHLTLVERECTLAEVVAEATARSRRAVGRPGAAIDVQGVPELLLRVDADALRQVLENLLVNALTHAGPQARVVVMARVDAAGVEVDVEDDGLGIPTDEQARIFEPFGRGDRTRMVPGFGLGLAIARDLATALGGSLAVTSPVRPTDATHPGTRFTLRLPAARLLPAGR